MTDLEKEDEGTEEEEVNGLKLHALTLTQPNRSRSLKLICIFGPVEVPVLIAHRVPLRSSCRANMVALSMLTGSGSTINQ